MVKKVTGLQVLTANLLNEGMVVFLGRDEAWSSRLDVAQVAHSDTEIERLEAKGLSAVRANLVVDPYLVEVKETDGSLVPVAHRERLRSTLRPTITFGTGANAAQGVYAG